MTDAVQDQFTMRDPLTQYPQPSFSQQPQSAPGLAQDMHPKPDHGETSYRGFGRLAGRRAIITGADSGIGRATAIAFAREGADVVLSYLASEQKDADEVIALIEATGQKAIAMPGDIGDEAFCTKLVTEGAAAMGGLDILVNVAGKQTAVEAIADLTTANIEATYRINVFAMMWLCKAAIPLLPKGGTIINTTSIQAYQPSPMLLDYAGTKAAIVAFTHGLAKQVADKGIRVNAVAPGPVWTPLQPSGGQPAKKIPDFGSEVPLKRPGQPAELAPIYVLLASQEFELRHRRDLRRHRRQPPALTLPPARATAGPQHAVRRDDVLPLDQYAALGDGRSVAMAGADGSIDWLCVPGLDSKPLFDRLIAGPEGGRCSITPAGPFTVARAYRPDSNVLEQVFTTPGGTARLTASLNGGISGRLPWTELAHRVEGLTGSVRFDIAVRPSRRLWQATPWREASPHGDVLHVDGVLAAFRCDDSVRRTHQDDDGVRAVLDTAPGSRSIIAVLATADEPLVLPELATIDARIDRSDQSWREWCGNLTYVGAFRDDVRRSALALKLLLHAPTGAIAAAATSALPERIGGAKNYDYRYAWVRDVAYSIKAFLRVGAIEEARAAFAWLIATIRRHDSTIRVMYRLDGALAPREAALDLPGYRGSTPVLDGNDARDQLQLGVFGDVMETASLFVQCGHVLDLVTRRLLTQLADQCADLWRSADSGIWELRTPQQFTMSKLGCWTAMERAVGLAEAGQIDASHADRWRRTRDAIRDWIDAECWSEARQAYVMHPGTDRLDAGILLATRFGFERRDRLALTREAIRRELAHGPLVYRYSGAEQEEGTFLACAFWMVEAYALLGEQEEARRLLGTLLDVTRRNLGLLNEQMDAGTHAMLGNAPQALSHLALIHAAMALQDG